MKIRRDPSLRRSHFSLVELLVVIGIISILSVMAVSMLDSRSSALLHAGGALADMSSLARENALSQNAPTALLVVTNAMSAGAAYSSRAVTVIQMDAQRNWSQIAKWTILPASVIITNSSAAALPALPAASGTQFLRLNGKSLDMAQCGLAYVFDTDGRLISNSTEPSKVRVAMAGGNAQANYYELVFNANTGTYKINRP